MKLPLIVAALLASSGAVLADVGPNPGTQEAYEPYLYSMFDTMAEEGAIHFDTNEHAITECSVPDSLEYLKATPPVEDAYTVLVVGEESVAASPKRLYAVLSGSLSIQRAKQYRARLLKRSPSSLRHRLSYFPSGSPSVIRDSISWRR